MTDASRDDIAAMRRQGDLRAYLRDQIAAGAARRDQKPEPAAVTPQPTGRRPGEWPPGTQPPSPHLCPTDRRCPLDDPETTRDR